MANKRLFYLYMYKNKENKKAYIGVTCDPKQRFKKHANGKSAAIAFNHAVQKDGIDQFDLSILAVFDEVQVANYHENAAISAFGTLSPNGYNLIGGAPKSIYFGPMSQETKDKIGKTNRKTVLTRDHLSKMLDARKGKPNHALGKKFTLEHREKLSQAHKGKPLSPEHRANIISALSTAEARARASEKTINLWKDEEYRKKCHAGRGNKKGIENYG